jgi:SAM-dependent methyltransferase
VALCWSESSRIPIGSRPARARGLQVHQGTFDGGWVESMGKFDVVVFADVLEHLPDPAAPLHLARTVLRPSGAVVASVPNVAHWSVRWDLLWGRFTYTPSGIMDATHLRWFTERSVRALFEASGYRIERLSHTLGAALPLYRERRLWRSLPQHRVRSVLRLLTRVMPRVFGCQHVIRAFPRALES